MTPYALPSTFAQLWIDSSVQVLQSATAFWGQVLSSAPTNLTTPQRTSTAAPWWKAPDTSSTAAAAFDPFAWASMWVPPSAASPSSSVAANIWAPWLPQQAPAAAFANPMELWQQVWLQNLPQLTAIGASMALPAAGAGAAWPNATVAPAAAVPAAWQPIATAYRTANGHAMAAVLRTLADVVEPKSRPADIMSFWTAPLSTRH